jgi:hypothetical protein
MDREAAWRLVQESVQAAGLRRHMLSVEAAMRGYAARLGEDPETWGLAELLHDWDWEIHPTLEQHPGRRAAAPARRPSTSDRRAGGPRRPCGPACRRRRTARPG